MALFCTAIRRDSISLLKFPFLSHVQVFLCEVLFISRLERPQLFFFPFLFPSYCHSVVHHVVSIVSDCCNQSSFVFFYVVLESYRCVNTVFNSSSPLPPFLIHIVCQHCLWDVVPYASLLLLLLLLLLFSSERPSANTGVKNSQGIK